MARRARTYTRDNRGRFASSPGGGPKTKPKPRTSFRQRQAVSLARSRGQTGRLGSATKAAKARLKATKARTGAGASPQQKAALTRAKRMASMLAGERRVKTGGGTGILRGAAAKAVKKAVGARVRPKVAAAKPVTVRPTSKVVPRSERRRVTGPRKAGVIAKPKGALRRGNPATDAKKILGFMDRARVPSRQVDWGPRSRKQGKRIGGGMIIGSMSAAPTGIRKYPDYQKAKGVTRKTWEEIRPMPDEYKKAVIGAIQSGWSANRALVAAYMALP